MEIGERIKMLRERCGMTQTELALKMGYTDKSTISKIESNQRDLARSKVKLAADALGVEPGYLMGWKEDQEDFDLQLFAAPPPEAPEITHLIEIARKLSAEDLRRLIIIAETFGGVK